MVTGKIENPLAFGLPEVVRWLEKWTPDAGKWLRLVADVQEGKAVVWAAGRTKSALDGLLILALPEIGLTDRAQVVGLPHRGTEARNALISAMVAFLQERGYTRVVAGNDTGRDDAVWLRAYQSVGPVTRKVSLFEFNVEPKRGQDQQDDVRRQRAEVRVSQQPGRPQPVREPPTGVRRHTARAIQERWRTGVQRPVRTSRRGGEPSPSGDGTGGVRPDPAPVPTG